MKRDGGGDFASRQSKILHEVSCTCCERLHRVEHPLEFNPICPGCAGRYPVALEILPSYPLTDETIDATVTRTSPGNYTLGYMDGGTYTVFYVGRSDSDLKGRLHEWVGVPSKHKRYAPSAKAACASRHRAASPLGAPALDGVGITVDSSYTRFAFSYAPSSEAAFERECRTYHDFGASDGLDNDGHPMAPLGSSWVCLMHHE